MASRVYGHVIGRRSGEVIGRVSDLSARGGSGSLLINVNVRELAALADRVGRLGDGIPAAVARALNRTVEETRTAVTRALVKQAGAKYGIVHRALSLQRANAAFLTAAIIARGSFLPLAVFAVRQTKKGVSAAPWGKRRVFPHTFIIRRYGGNVYKRVGKPRFPLHKLYGPAIPREMTRDQSRETFYATAPAVLAKRLDHELTRVLAR